MGGKRKSRCKLCGGVLEAWNLQVCDDCQAAGFTAPRKGEMEGTELIERLKVRETYGIPLLKGLGAGEIAAAARAWNAPGYVNYGAFRAWCERMGKLPPKIGGTRR